MKPEPFRIEIPDSVLDDLRAIDHPPREFAERAYDVRRWSEMPRGGHFAAWEEPELLAQELREFFRPLR